MHMVRYGFAVYKEIGLSKGGTLRADLLCLNFKKKLVIMEVKSSTADISSDFKCQALVHMLASACFIFATVGSVTSTGFSLFPLLIARTNV